MSLTFRVSPIPLKILGIGLVSMSATCLGQTKDELWQSHREILQFTQPALGQIDYPWFNAMHDILLRSFNKLDQAKDLVALHELRGTKALNTYPRCVGPLTVVADPQNGVEIRHAVVKSMRLYAQKETKVDFIPQSWQGGLRFKIGDGAAPGTASQGFVINGDPEMRYGLRLKGIEPNKETLKLASNGSEDYEYLQYAPKAHLNYEVGEVYPDGYARSFPIAIPGSDQVPRPTFWSSLPGMPDIKFSGRVTPRGMPGPGSPLPPQSIFLDQSQGYYQMEAQLSGSLKQENVLHRFRVPLINKINYLQERNRSWQFTRTVFENIYNNDDGFVMNLERYHFEHRYQVNFQFHKLINHFELFLHVPDRALAVDNFWTMHRWESRFDMYF